MPRDFHEFSGDWGIAVFSRNRQAAIAGFTGCNVDRDLAEERDPEPSRFAFAAAGTEDVVAFPIARAGEVTHVFDQAEHGHVDLLEHSRGFARVDQGHFLWCG